MFSILLRPKPALLMITLKDNVSIWYPSKLAKTCKISFVYVSNLVIELEKTGLLVSEIKGKKRIVKLTEKGLKIAGYLESIRNELEIKPVLDSGTK